MLGMGLICVVAAGGGHAQKAAPPPPGPVTIDLNPTPGDQGRREVRGVRPGTEVIVEIVALRDARGITGFTATLAFDPAQLSYEAFEGGQLIPQMQTLPLLRDGTLEVGGSQLGGGPGAVLDGGTLGFARFRVTPRFSGQAAVTLVRARYRRRGEMRNFDTQVKTTLFSAVGKPARSTP